ncbi:MAG: riboflavin synthase [Candidatus Peregrinibacteria bacterium]
MFTGIIEATAKVTKLSGGKLTVERPKLFDDIKLGCSIAISGACLTVVSFDTKSMTFDVIPETFAKTTLGTLKKGDAVDLERALPAHGRFEGHVVQGHIEGVGEVVRVESVIGELRLTIRPPASLRPMIVTKGAIAVDGVSLTIANTSKDTFTIALIPTTLTGTILGEKKVGDGVNLETDILVRTLIARRE